MVKLAASRHPEGFGGGNGGKVPAWDLSDLYGSDTDPRIEADLTQALARAQGFESAHQGKVAALSGAALAAAVAEYEAIEEVLGQVMSYAQLRFSADSTDPAAGKFYQTMSERVTAIGTHLLFFTLEINRIAEAALDEKLQDPALARYRPWLRDPAASALRRAGKIHP